MASFLKCKMCGGDLRIISGLNIAECEYCGTRQSVPKTPDERKKSYFNRANEARRANEFDKAIGIYESIVAEYPDEAEAYWGLCLCKFGIEYVDDPKTGRKIPTCHRTAYDSIFEDKDYNSAISHGDMDQIRIFKQEASVIDRIQKSILNSVNLENPYDVFICYKETDERTGQRTQESVIGQELFENLCSRDIRTFFARVSLEDVLGEEYEPHIFAALNSARIMLVLGSSNSNFNAPWVRNEWSRYLELARKDKAHSIIPCFISMDPYDLPNEFSNLQAQDLGKVGAIQDVIRGVEKILNKTQSKPIIQAERSTASTSSTEALFERGKIALRNGEWKKSQSYFDKVLNSDPRNADVYAHLLMIENKCRSLEELAQVDVPIKNSSNFKNVLEFADDDLAKKLNKISATIDKRYYYIKGQIKKRILITTLSIVLVTGIGIAVFAWIKTTPQRVYRKAAKLVDAEEYKEAYEYIKKNSSFSNLSELFEKCLLAYANASIEQGNYEYALDLLKEASVSEEKTRLINDANCRNAIKSLSDSSVGDTIYFGSYPQKDINSNSQESIEWYVIGKNKDNAILLSKNNLDYIHGHNGNTYKTIEDSFSYLNDTFYGVAFTNNEKEYIQPIVMNILDDREIRVNVFILNDEMIPRLSDNELIGTTTDYAANKGAARAKAKQNAGVWLVDYASKSQGGRTNSIIKYVGLDGKMTTTERIDVGLRPAICLRFNSNSKSKEVTEEEITSLIPENTESNSADLDITEISSTSDDSDTIDESYVSDRLRN